VRPTRWTRQRRVTYWGKGGWHICWDGVGYTHPVTGDGVFTDWRNVRDLLRLRREGEAEHAR